MKEGIKMDYEKAYKILFNAMTDAIEKIDSSGSFSPAIAEGLEILKKAQRNTEEMYLDAD